MEARGYSCANQQVFIFSEDGYNAVNEIKNELECLTCLNQFLFHATHCNTDWKFPIKNIFDSRIVRERKTNRVRVAAPHVVVANNNSNETQTIQSISYSETVTDSHDFTQTYGAKITSKNKVFLPFLGKAELSVELSGNWAVKVVKTKSQIFTVPSQQCKVPPFSKVKLIWELFKYDYVYETLFDFELDDTNEEIQLLKQLHLGKSNFQRFHFNTKNELHPDRIGIYLEGMDSLVLKNYPITEAMNVHELMITIRPAEPLNAREDPVDAVIINF